MTDAQYILPYLQRRLEQHSGIDQFVLLAKLAQELAACAIAMTRPAHNSDQPTLQQTVDRLRVFTAMQARVSQTMLDCRFADGPDTDFVQSLYAAAQGIGCETEVKAALQRVLDFPTRREQCPCCGYYTLAFRHEWDICPVCFWEDESSDTYGEPTTWRGGANHVGLQQARENYKSFGASEKRVKKFVRPPAADELPANNQW